jgi:hypothetical protein
MHGRKIVAALMVVAMLIPVIATAQYNVVERNANRNMIGSSQAGIYRADSTARLLTTDGSGNLNVVEQYPASSFFIFKPNWLNTVLQHRCAGGPPPSPAVMQDSTSAEDVRGANNLALMVYPTFKDSVGTAIIALQVRWHFTSGAVDSATSFIEQATRTFYASSGGASRDSIGSLLYASAASSPTYNTNKYGGATYADSLATPDEQVLVLTNVAGQNRGRLIRLTPPNAPNGAAAGPFLSIRVRHLNSTHQTTGAFLGDGTSGFDQPVRLNIALVGWR